MDLEGEFTKIPIPHHSQHFCMSRYSDHDSRDMQNLFYSEVQSDSAHEFTVLYSVQT